MFVYVLMVKVFILVFVSNESNYHNVKLYHKHNVISYLSEMFDHASFENLVSQCINIILIILNITMSLQF